MTMGDSSLQHSIWQCAVSGVSLTNLSASAASRFHNPKRNRALATEPRKPSPSKKQPTLSRRAVRGIVNSYFRVPPGHRKPPLDQSDGYADSIFVHPYG